MPDWKAVTRIWTENMTGLEALSSLPSLPSHPSSPLAPMQTFPFPPERDWKAQHDIRSFIFSFLLFSYRHPCPSAATDNALTDSPGRLRLSPLVIVYIIIPIWKQLNPFWRFLSHSSLSSHFSRTSCSLPGHLNYPRPASSAQSSSHTIGAPTFYHRDV